MCASQNVVNAALFEILGFNNIYRDQFHLQLCERRQLQWNDRRSRPKRVIEKASSAPSESIRRPRRRVRLQEERPNIFANRPRSTEHRNRIVLLLQRSFHSEEEPEELVRFLRVEHVLEMHTI